MNIGLTKREIEVCSLLLLGLSYTDAGKRLSISRRTIEDHSLTVQRKFGVNSYQHLLSELWKLAE